MRTILSQFNKIRKVVAHSCALNEDEIMRFKLLTSECVAEITPILVEDAYEFSEVRISERIFWANRHRCVFLLSFLSTPSELHRERGPSTSWP